ncbi:MAG TPA: 3-isopropylmalate dehydrogenase, partial [Desulfovibrio sp.]|nr:3-isopropylmalate dehydrogenase [Desulfovibrio sp.]
SVAMMLKHSFNEIAAADAIEAACAKVLAEGYRTGDIMEPGRNLVGCKAMGDLVVARLG